MLIDDLHPTGGTNMRYAKLITLLTAAFMAVPACKSKPDDTAARDDARTSSAAAEIDRQRSDDTKRMEERIAEIDRQWIEMQRKVTEKGARPTAGLVEEVKEDVQNIRNAVADLHTTTPDNWWERHEGAMERTAADIESDVRRFTKAPVAAGTTGAAALNAPFESRRDQFVDRLEARIEAMLDQLKDVKASGAQQTELEDTRARLNKLKDDVGRLRRASAEDWWDISAKRVDEYIDRVDASIRRVDNDKR
jgi:hypothetical protein